MCAVQIIESIMGITPLVVIICDNRSAFRRSLIHPESVILRWKKADLIFCMLDVYHSIDFGMSLVHMYGHQNSGKLASNLTPLSSLNVLFDALAEYIVASYLSLPTPRTTIAVGLSDPYGLTSVSICGVPVHSDLYWSIVYEIPNHRLLKYWVDRKIHGRL